MPLDLVGWWTFRTYTHISIYVLYTFYRCIHVWLYVLKEHSKKKFSVCHYWFFNQFSRWKKWENTAKKKKNTKTEKNSLKKNVRIFVCLSLCEWVFFYVFVCTLPRGAFFSFRFFLVCVFLTRSTTPTTHSKLGPVYNLNNIHDMTIHCICICVCVCVCMHPDSNETKKSHEQKKPPESLHTLQYITKNSLKKWIYMVFLYVYFPLRAFFPFWICKCVFVQHKKKHPQSLPTSFDLVYVEEWREVVRVLWAYKKWTKKETQRGGILYI